ncbi:MAG: cytochrome C oxidase subunit IV family protein [Planctomycetia bacterium]|jgi:cytochrome c oxidase subunit 4
MSHHDHHEHGPITRPGGTADDPGHGHDDSHGGHEEHHGGLGTYLAVFLALCFLTSMSFLTFTAYWPWRDQPQVGWAFMMAVSCTKAMLVILFFMHVLWEANWKYVLTIPAAMMAVFLAIMLIPDIGMRNRMISQERAVHMARPADVSLLERAGAQHAGEAAAAH